MMKPTYNNNMINNRTPAAIVRATPINIVVDNPEWQIVRKKMIGNWKHNHIECVEVLRAYLNVNLWSPVAVRRVLNVLVGTVHRVGHTRGQHETADLRLSVRREWAMMHGEPIDELRGEI